MSDGISEGYEMAEERAQESLFLLETLRLLFEEKNEDRKFDPSLEGLQNMKRALYTSVPNGRTAQLAKEKAAGLVWDGEDLLNCKEKERAWARFIYALLFQGHFRNKGLFQAVSEISILTIDHPLACGTIGYGEKRELRSQGDEQMLGIWMESVPEEDRLAFGPEDHHFLLGFDMQGGFRLYFF